MTTPLRVAAWREALASHPDQEFASYIVQGITEGFRIGFDYNGHSCQKASTNLVSAMAHPKVVDDYLGKEGGLDRIP